MASTARVGGLTAMMLVAVAVGVFFPAQYLTAGLADLAEQRVGLADAYAGEPAFFQIALYVHVVSAGVALILGGFQFSGRLRRRSPVLHKTIGRVYLAAVAPAAISGGALAFVNQAELTGFFGFGALALLWAYTTFRGFRAIRGGDVASHRAWMMRSYALSYAAVTLRLWQVIAMTTLGLADYGGDVFATAYAPVPFLCWIPNLIVVEMMIARRGLPGLRYVSPVGPQASTTASTGR